VCVCGVGGWECVWGGGISAGLQVVYQLVKLMNS
jgi:hypothetical protein